MSDQEMSFRLDCFKCGAPVVGASSFVAQVDGHVFQARGIYRVQCQRCNSVYTVTATRGEYNEEEDAPEMHAFREFLTKLERDWYADDSQCHDNAMRIWLSDLLKGGAL